MSDKKSSGVRTHQAGAFDVRTFIAALIGLYGVILLGVAFFGTSDADLAKADGLRVNLWTGLGLLAFALAFQGWAMLRPVRVPDDPQAEAAEIDDANR